MKGIILAGGSGTRLNPITKGICKQLIPIYDKPMIYYPLSVLMMAGIKDILIICNEIDLHRFQSLFNDGSDLGLCISYIIQNKPEGIAQSFIIGEQFIQNDSVCLILGDNIFFGSGLEQILQQCTSLTNGGLIFGYPVKDPERYGVIEFNNDIVTNIIEKPSTFKSRYAVPGLYFYDNNVISIAKTLSKSDRGEYEITDINNAYLQQNKLKVKLLDTGFCWMDTGTHESLHQASNFVQAVQERQGIKIACIEEIAYKLKYISKQDLNKLSKDMLKNDYGKYLQRLIE